MPEMHLKQPGFTYSACGWFARNKGRIEKFMQTGTIDYIYKMILIKIVFNMIWLMVNIKIWIKEQNQVRFWEIKVMKMQVIQNMIDLKDDQLQ